MTLTQNIDGLHQLAGLPSEAVIELHGTLHDSVCVECADRRPMAETLDRVRAGSVDPECGQCGGVLKSATIFFGEPLGPQVLQTAAHAVATSDLLIAIGTSLTVKPVSGLVPFAVRAGVPVIIVNAEATPYDEVAEVVVRAPIGIAVPELVAAGVSAPGSRGAS
jgi:NAD-dependent deacetylase